MLGLHQDRAQANDAVLVGLDVRRVFPQECGRQVDQRQVQPVFGGFPEDLARPA